MTFGQSFIKINALSLQAIFLTIQVEYRRRSCTFYENQKALKKDNEIEIREASRQLNIPKKNLQQLSQQTEFI